MTQAGVEVLICRFPENVLYLTGFWPITGRSAVLFPVEGEATLFVPQDEAVFADSAWTGNVVPFPATDLHSLTSVGQRLAALLPTAAARLGDRPRVVAHDGGLPLIAVSPWQGELHQPGPENLQVLAEAFPGAELRDGSPLLRTCREVKSPAEVAAIRRSADIAELGFRALHDAIRPGLTELEVAALMESTLMTRGPGYRNTRWARGFCQVMSGPWSVNAGWSFMVTTPRTLEPGDLAVVELGVYSDGYWADLTRVFCAGRPSEQARAIYRIVEQANLAARQACRPGVAAAEVDAAARRVIAGAGYGDYFPHPVGHGVGLAYHEPPFLHPASATVLQPGMVLAVEPGIYLPGMGGIRLEDNVVITASGAEVLSPFAFPLA